MNRGSRSVMLMTALASMSYQNMGAVEVITGCEPTKERPPTFLASGGTMSPQQLLKLSQKNARRKRR